MKNLDEPQRNETPTEDEGAYKPDSDLPASPEEVGITRETPVTSAAPLDPMASGETLPASEAEPIEIEGAAIPETEEMDEIGALDEDRPVNEAPPPTLTEEPKRSRSRWLLITFLGLLLLLSIAAISAFGGYRSGITLRRDAESTQLSAALKQQYILGVQDLEEGNYYRAKQRFEYVIGIDPLYPGAAENLSAALFELNTTATPTLVPTPTLTPTPDTRGNQELFDQASVYLNNSEWDNAIETLLSLRKSSPDYLMVQVDGMLFIALRNRGRDKIILEQDLEGGIYDLTLAQRFGILDAEADGLLDWTQLYITGASFWEIDWGQAAYYFGQVAPHLPNLMDKSGITAGERYRQSLIGYGYQLAEQKKWCESFKQLQLALSIAYDAQIEKDLNTVAERCDTGDDSD